MAIPPPHTHTHTHTTCDRLVTRSVSVSAHTRVSVSAHASATAAAERRARHGLIRVMMCVMLLLRSSSTVGRYCPSKRLSYLETIMGQTSA